MPINVNEVKLQVEDLARKDQTTGYITPPRINRAFYLAQLEEVNYQREGFENGAISSYSLSGLKKVTSFVVGSDGLLVKPTDYLFLSAIYNNAYVEIGDATKFVKKEVDIVTDNEAGSRINSQLRHPSERRPIAIEYDGSFKIYPPNLPKVELAYIRNPPSPVWAFTVVSGRDVYSSADSIDFDLPEHLFSSIVWRVCRQLGIQTRQQDLTGAAAQMLATENKD